MRTRSEPLVELMADFKSSMVDKSALRRNRSRRWWWKEGFPVLVEIVEVGTQRQKEMGVSILLQLCEESVVNRTIVAPEGAIPPVAALSQTSKSRAKLKAEALIKLLRQPRQQHFDSNVN